MGIKGPKPKPLGNQVQGKLRPKAFKDPKIQPPKSGAKNAGIMKGKPCQRVKIKAQNPS